MKRWLVCVIPAMIILLSSCASNADLTQEINTGDSIDVVQDIEDEIIADKSDSLKDVRYISITDTYDTNDDLSLQRGMRTMVNDVDEENEFLSYFFRERSDVRTIEEESSIAFVGTSEDDNIFVFLAPIGDEKYPRYAYGFKYSMNNSQAVALFDPSANVDDIYNTICLPDGSAYEYAKLMKPLLDYQDKDFTYDENNNMVKVSYISDPEKYGTFNSSGVLFYDSQNRPLYREYYVTSGERISYYLYDENNPAVYYDFGGMAYKGMDSNQDIEIGVDLDVYVFDR